MTVANRARLLGHLRAPFVPTDIPRSLAYAVWDFEQTGRITPIGGNISAFSDPITAASFSQGTAGSRPTLNATGFNGRQCAVFDGVDDSLRNTTAVATLGWPTGGAFELWALVEWTAAALSTGQGVIFQYPTNAVNTGAQIAANFVGTNLMRYQFRVGTGASSVQIIDATVDATTGRHLVRGISDGTNIRFDVDGVVGAPVACVASGFTGGPRATIGGNSAGTAGSLWSGNINFLGFYKTLPTAYAAGLYRNLNIRKG